MIVTELESGYRIEHEDGTVETVEELPASFVPYQSMSFSGGASSPALTKLRKATGRRFQTLEDLQMIPNLLEDLRKLNLPLPKMREFFLDILRRLDTYLRQSYGTGSNALGDSNPCQEGDPLNRLINVGAKAMLEEWEIRCHRLGPLMFDYAGIKQHLQKLRTIEERIDFLKDVEWEMWRPCWAYPANHYEGQSDTAPYWYVAVEYRHALTPTDMRRIVELRSSWERSYPTDVLRQTAFVEPDARVGHGSAVDVAANVAANVPRAVEIPNYPADVPAGDPRRLKWTGGQMDLVFLIDRLKAVGLLAPTTTDADVIDHFDFGGTAEDLGKNYRNIRRKVKRGGSHPNAEKYGVLVSLFLDRVTALPVPEPLRHLLLSHVKEKR